LKPAYSPSRSYGGARPDRQGFCRTHSLTNAARSLKAGNPKSDIRNRSTLAAMIEATTHMFKYTKYLLEKIEQLFGELGYTVRYERGSFQSGYCLVHQQRIVVINKFFETEARINTLLEILDTLSVDTASLSPTSQQTYEKIHSILNQEDSPASE
jgi:hypothetical protein